MKFFGFDIGKKRSLKWESLSDSQKKLVAKRLGDIAYNMAGSRYKVISGSDQFNREQGITESKDEDNILSKWDRGRLLSLCRNQMRNSPTFQSITRSLIQNSIGTDGGKVILEFSDETITKDTLSQFKRFGKNAEFFNGFSWNETLKTVFLEYILGGDCVILFDSGYVTGSNKVLVFESDEIGDVDAKTVQRHYGSGATSENGIVHDQYGREIGVIVSRACRGMDEFDPKKCYFLRKDPDSLPEENDWIMPKNTFRSGQGRGITKMSAMLANNEDLEMLNNFELQSAKQASQTLMQIFKESSEEKTSIPSAFGDIDFEHMTDEQIEEFAKNTVKEEMRGPSLQSLQAANVIYQVLPDNYKAQLIDTKRPNPNLPQFIEFLCQRSGMPFGLPIQFITLAAENATYRAQALMAKPSFQDIQHFLEQICDWAFSRWAKATGIEDNLPEDYMDFVSWIWPDIQELDENSHQDYINKGLSNFTLTYKEVLGPDWKRKLKQSQVEMSFFKQELQAPHPAIKLLSGGESEYVKGKKVETVTQEHTTQEEEQ